jgi:hypothetical protein
VDVNAFDLCSSMTVKGLRNAACDTLDTDGNTPAGHPARLVQEMLKNCIDAINNNGLVVPVTPCPYTFPNPPAPCPTMRGSLGRRSCAYLLPRVKT